MLNFCLLSGFSGVFFVPLINTSPRPVLTCNLRLCLICLHKHWPPPFPPSLISSFISSLSSIFYGRRNGNVGGFSPSPCFFHGREQRQRSAPDSRTKRIYGDKNQNKRSAEGDPCAAAEERSFGCSCHGTLPVLIAEPGDPRTTGRTGTGSGHGPRRQRSGCRGGGGNRRSHFH